MIFYLPGLFTNYMRQYVPKVALWVIPSAGKHAGE